MGINKKYLMNDTINHLKKRMNNREYDLIENDDNFSVYPINFTEKEIQDVENWLKSTSEHH